MLHNLKFPGEIMCWVQVRLLSENRMAQLRVGIWYQYLSGPLSKVGFMYRYPLDEDQQILFHSWMMDHGRTLYTRIVYREKTLSQ
jgi:hypothetical protein